MSPQNCLAILSPGWVGSSPQERRRSDERVGVKGETGRNASDACGAVNHRGAGDGGSGGKTFGDFSTTDEATTAQAKRARGGGTVAWQSRQSSVEQNGLREDREST